VLTPTPTEKVLTNSEGGVDENVYSHPSIDQKERTTWRLASSRILIRPTKKRYRVSYDMDLLPFQAGADASDDEETDYLDINLDGKLIDGVKLETPKIVDDLIRILPTIDLVRSMVQPRRTRHTCLLRTRIAPPVL